MTCVERLSTDQARKLVLLSQRLFAGVKGGKSLSNTLEAIEHLGYVQIDTISAVERAHHHVLWTRNSKYKPAHINILLKNRQIFEYWAHAAAYLPMCDYRYSLWRKDEIARGKQNHWFREDVKLMDHVLERISEEGALMARDFESKDGRSGDWSSKPEKQALENLFMRGELMIVRRENFQKVYDLTQRVLPEGIDRSIPDAEEYARYLIQRYLGANGLGSVTEICYLQKNIKDTVTSVIQEMQDSGELVEILVDAERYYSLRSSLELLGKRLQRSRARILSPFDNMLIQRKRMQRLFGFDYQLECYMPEKKRRYGYFSLPVMWRGRFAARVDCRAERKRGELHIHNFILEDDMVSHEAFARAVVRELAGFARFNSCESVVVHNVAPELFKGLLIEEISEIHQ